MSDRIEDMVEDPRHNNEIATAKNMPDAANAGHSLMGYAAINGATDQDRIARVAFDYYQRRQELGEPGSADDDWFRAEAEVLRGRESGSP
ncbi:MAG TPA: DUF2934 domain-containing protein [Bryobacteraceae bacterium]|nr:DUF2934 domain-containing protein [Bryobacteraceae bacterium]